MQMRLMNKKKWKQKFARKDSGRFLKRNDPYYSDPYQREKMPPVGSWIGKARGAVERYPENKRKDRERYEERGFRRSAETAALAAMESLAGRELAAVEAAIAETRRKYPQTAARRLELAGRMYCEKQDMEQARKAVNVSRETADRWAFYFLRSVGWHLGLHYNHTGRNHYGNTRKQRGCYR